MAFGEDFQERIEAPLDGAEDPQRVAALVTLWVLWLGGTAGFVAVDRFVSGVDVTVFDLGWGLVTLSLVVVAVVTLRRQY
jgi:hypothetical protein